MSDYIRVKYITTVTKRSGKRWKYTLVRSLYVSYMRGVSYHLKVYTINPKALIKIERKKGEKAKDLY